MAAARSTTSAGLAPAELQGWLAANAVRLRDGHGWSQARAAEACGMSLRRYQSVEAGQANVTLAMVAHMALGFETSLGELLRSATAPAKRTRGRPRNIPVPQTASRSQHELAGLVAELRTLTDRVAVRATGADASESPRWVATLRPLVMRLRRLAPRPSRPTTATNAQQVSRRSIRRRARSKD